MKPKIVCLCGSVRFKEDFEAENFRFTLKGYIVLAPGCFNHEMFHDPNLKPYLEKKEELDALHRAKIDLANLVYIINTDGYIGESTRSEIEYAKSLGKPIEYMEMVS